MTYSSQDENPVIVNAHSSREVEQFLLVNILVNSDAFCDVARIVSPEMFTVAWIGECFAAMLRLDHKGVEPDLNAVTTEFRAIRTASNGGDAWEDALDLFNQLQAFVVDGEATSLANQIREFHQQRAALLIGGEIVRCAGERLFDRDAIVGKLDELSVTLDDCRLAPSDPLIATQRANDALSYAIEHGEVMGYKSGHWLFDRNSLGFVDGSIGVEAADTGGGKTHNLWHRCRTFTRINQVNAGLISGEMTEDELIQRQVIGDRNLALAASGKMEPHAEQAIRKRLQDYAKTPTEVIRPPSMALNDVLAATRLLARRRQCKLICIDYAQMIHVKGERDPNEAARRVYGELKDLAMRLGIAVLIASQFNKQGRREQSKHSPMAITEQDIYGSSHASFYAHTISHTIRLSHALHDDRMRRVADKLRDLGVDPMTVTIERILKSRRGQKQRYTMASEFKGWAMRPLDAEKHRAIRDLMNTPGDTNADTPTDPAEHFMRSSQPSADTTANGFKASF